MPIRNSNINWVFPEEVLLPDQFQSGIGGSTVVSQTLYRRGLTTLHSARGFLSPDHYSPTPASQLPGLIEASKRIQSALNTNETILVWGDFDVDGQTSTTLLVSALHELGGKVSHYIPNRARESHGLTVHSLRDQIDKIQPSLILTCDTGIDAIEPVAEAQKYGIDVIITDHHQLSENLPNAHSIINPNLLSSDHPLFSLPGVGVAYKLVEYLFRSNNLDSTHFLDLVALGIVADVAELKGDTRYLLQRGLPLLRNTPRLGLQQLFANAKLKNEGISEEQIGFVIGPRLNALGRLSDANSCVDFFTTDMPSLASHLARELEMLNFQRQELTESIFQSAIDRVESEPGLVEDYPVLVLLGPPDWNPGVIGIVASRLVDRYHLPVIMLTQQGDLARGSARSIPGVPISDLIASASDYLISHGGHPMAAGVNLQGENVSSFRRKLADNFSSIVGKNFPSPTILIDAILPFDSISPDYINDFQRLAPFGAGNPKLLFASRGVKVSADTSIGKNQNHRKLSLIDSAGSERDILWWNSVGIDLPVEPFDIAYSLALATYKDQTQTQLTLQHFRPSLNKPILITENERFVIIDLRRQKEPIEALREVVLEYPSAIIWSELNSPPGFKVLPREDLMNSQTLVIWTTPPSPIVLRQALDSVSPNTVILFAENPLPLTKHAVIQGLLGLLKHLHNTGKVFNSSLFSQALGQTTTLIELGLLWIHEHGDYDLSQLTSKNIISAGPGTPLPGFSEADKRFSLLLQEISSYRHFFTNADKEYLL
ncbi:MAG: single-stranded-DNA-specific exonuclease RecJ [Anaerolineales bacterium]|nr:single-stranded-DNA-specific exonuclease RecJ [Anaerolineales bacterium]